LALSHSSVASATSRQPLSKVSEWPRPSNFLSSVTAVESRYCFSVDRVTTSGTVWSAVPEMRSSGPRSLLSVSTAACACTTKLAAAAWKRGRAGDGIVHRSYSSADSSSVTALPNPYRNSFSVSVTEQLLRDQATEGVPDRDRVTSSMLGSAVRRGDSCVRWW
jgi:hypothetical protein